MIADSRVVVVTGAGGMGAAVASRLGLGATLVIADLDRPTLEATANDLRDQGFETVEHLTDVSDAGSVDQLAEAAARLGRVEVLVHTAGVSPVQASVDAVLKVDLLGAALMLDAFGSVMAPGGAAVFISSMAGTFTSLEPSFERRLASTPTDALLDLPELSPDLLTDSGTAYGIAKRANQIRVQAAATAWGARGARVNSISPGVIATPMGAAELRGPSGDYMRAMVAGSPTGRLGTPSDIAAAVEFLTGPQARFITGTDLLVDGGVVASLLTATGLP